MKNLFVVLTLAVASMATSSANAAFVIDDFGMPDYSTSRSTVGTSGYVHVGPDNATVYNDTVGGVIGGRDIQLAVNARSGPPSRQGEAVLSANPFGVLDMVNSPDVTSTLSVRWITNNLNMLAGGLFGGIAVDVDYADIAGGLFSVTLTDSNGDSATGVPVVAVPAVNGSTYTVQFLASFFAGIDLSSISQIELAVTGASGYDVSISKVSTFDNVPPRLVPEPTSMALAGFAGIGMAFGAIRRRRQVNQAA